MQRINRALCMKVRELHTGQKVSWFETSALEKLLPLQNQLISPWGRSKQRGEKVWDCSRDWFAFVRVVPTRVHIRCALFPQIKLLISFLPLL